MYRHWFRNFYMLSVCVMIFVCTFLLNTFSFAQHAEKFDVVKFYEEKIKEGDNVSLLMLGNIYEEGKLVKRDIKKAIDYYEKAAQRNVLFANESLAIIYATGNGVKKDFKMAVKYFKKYAEVSPGSAFFRIANLYYTGGPNLKKDYLSAKYNYEKSAESEYSPAFLNLGIMYEKGQGVPKNYNIAKKYYEKSAYMGYPIIENTYADFYEFEKNSSSFSNYNLSHLYESGLGTPTNYIKSYSHILIAVALNSDEKVFIERKKYIEKKLNSEQIARGQDEANLIWEKIEENSRKRTKYENDKIKKMTEEYNTKMNSIEIDTMIDELKNNKLPSW